MGAQIEGNREGVHLARKNPRFFTGNTFLLIFWHFLPLFGYFTQFWSVFNETQDLSFFFKVILNRGVVFSVFRFVCLLGWPQALFCKTQLSSLLSLSRQTNDKFGNFFFSNFQGFTLVPWQKVGRICSKCLLYISQILFFPLPVNERYGTEAKISNFSSLIWFPNTLFFIQAFQNATFGVKNTALSQKLSKLAIFHLF